MSERYSRMMLIDRLLRPLPLQTRTTGNSFFSRRLISACNVRCAAPSPLSLTVEIREKFIIH